MSNRKERNWRKAKRRREKLLTNPLVVAGFEVHLDTYDFGRLLTLHLQRPDGWRCGVNCNTDRLWRRMDNVPMHMLAKLLAYLEANPEAVQ